MTRQRKQIRLKNYDYSQSGLYFVTICAHNRECIFGNIVGANHHSPVPKMVLNKFGLIVHDILNSLSNRYKQIELDVSQIMPNHVHTIINIVGAHHDAPNSYNDVPAYNRAIHESPLRKRSSLSQIIGYLKMNSAKLIHQINPHISVWQRNYYEHIIRNETDLNKIRGYIKTNSTYWKNDINHI